MTFVNRTPSGQREQLVDADFTQLEERSFYFSFVEDVTKIVSIEFKNYFATNPRVPKRFRWIPSSVISGKNETDLDSPLHIHAAHEDQPRRYPELEVTSVSGNIQDIFMGQRAGTLYIYNPKFNESLFQEYLDQGVEYLEPQIKEVGERLTGKMELNVKLTVRTRLPLERDRLTDLVLHGLVGPVRRRFHEQALNWLPNRGIFSEQANEEDTNQQPVFTRTVVFGLQGEWYDDFYYTSAQTLASVEDVIPIPVYLSLNSAGIV